MAWVLIGTATLHLLAAAATLLYRRVTLDVGLFQIRITNVDQLLLRALLLMTIAAIVSPGCRARVGEFMRARGFFVLALLPRRLAVAGRVASDARPTAESDRHLCGAVPSTCRASTACACRRGSR